MANLKDYLLPLKLGYKVSSGDFEDKSVSTSDIADNAVDSGKIASSAVSSGKIAGDAIDDTKIADNAVSLEHLDSGVNPSHVVKYAGEFTWSGGGSSVTETVTGATTSDFVVATIQSVPSEAAYIARSAITSSDTLTVELSSANTSNDAVIAYQVIRAAS